MRLKHSNCALYSIVIVVPDFHRDSHKFLKGFSTHKLPNVVLLCQFCKLKMAAKGPTLATFFPHESDSVTDFYFVTETIMLEVSW